MKWDDIYWLPAIDIYTSHPSKHKPNAGLMLAKRLGRWASINQALADRFADRLHLSISGPE